MRVLVTGAAGFIGAAVSHHLLERGDEVIGLDNFDTYYSVALKKARRDRIGATHDQRWVFLQADLRDAQRLDQALADRAFDTIIHLGARPGVRASLDAPAACIESNVLGHLNVLELARKREVAHLVYASSSSVYGGNETFPLAADHRTDRPLSLYAASKKANELMSETYAHIHRLAQTGLRFFTVYGPWGRPDMMMWLFTAKILAGDPLPLFNNGNNWRDFTYIDDIVRGVAACLDAPPVDDGSTKPGGSISPHALYNIGNSRTERVGDVVTLLEQALGRRARLDMLPMQPGDASRTHADIACIAQELGYEPHVPIEEGVARFVAWYRQYHQV